MGDGGEVMVEHFDGCAATPSDAAVGIVEVEDTTGGNADVAEATAGESNAGEARPVGVPHHVLSKPSFLQRMQNWFVS